MLSFETTSTGVQIGLRYTPPPRREIGFDAERIQAGLLGNVEPVLDRAFARIERAMPALILAIVIGALVIAVARKIF